MNATKRIPQILPHLVESEIEAVVQTMQDNWITEGKRSEEFVRRLKDLIGVPYGVLAPNGTLALTLGLMALGIKRGDEVLIPDVTFMGSASAVVLAGAIPVFVDVERDTFQIDVQSAEKCLSEKTRAIMPVHLYGTACNMTAIAEFAERHKLLIIEDAAQGIGVHYKGFHVGSIGDVGCFSFFADKTVTTGEGGFIACKNKDIYDKLLLLRNQGRISRGSFIHESIGFNFRMTDIQSAIGIEQLKKLDFIIERKKLLWKIYDDGLKSRSEVRVLQSEKDSTHVPFRCVLIAERLDALQQSLEANGIQTRSFFFPLHRQPAFLDPNNAASRSLGSDAYPNSDHGFNHGLCLPLYPDLKSEDVMYIVDQINAFYDRG